MSNIVFALVFFLGAAVVAWVGVGFSTASALALSVTLLIGSVYLLGFIELAYFRRNTQGLLNALQTPPSGADDVARWLNLIPLSLRNLIQLRFDGERAGLPGPALSPYLTGLLVMLGMLGTFIGMVVTLNGAVLALEGTPSMDAIRAALAAPIKGLGQAFGTSVAGVAASAMLGLASALSRRERSHASQVLDAKLAQELRPYSLTHSREQTFKALQTQAYVLPEVADKMQAIVNQMLQMQCSMQEKLVSAQQDFHTGVKQSYSGLADAVADTLKQSLGEAGRLVGESIQPALDATLRGIQASSQETQAAIVSLTRQEFEQLTQRFSGTADTLIHQMGSAETTRIQQLQQSLQSLSDDMRRNLQSQQEENLQHQQRINRELSAAATELQSAAVTSSNKWLEEMVRLFNATDLLFKQRIHAEETWLQTQTERLDALSSGIRAELSALRSDEAKRAEAAINQLNALQEATAKHLSQLGMALEEPVTRMLETAAQAPRAAAEAVAYVKEALSREAERELKQLNERNALLQSMDEVLNALNQTSEQQRESVAGFVKTATSLMESTTNHFGNQMAERIEQLTGIANQTSAGVIEIASLGDAFGVAVQQFSFSNEKLVENLNRIEQALEQSAERSNEQLAYYVAQAREVIDLSLLSQREFFDELRERGANAVKQTEEEVV